MRILAYDTGITVFSVDELIPYAIVAAILCVVFPIGVYFSYCKRIKEFINRQTEYVFKGETRLKIFFGFMIIDFCAYSYVCFVEPNIFNWSYVTCITIALFVYFTTGIIVIGEYDMFIDGTIIRREDISLIKICYGYRNWTIMVIIMRDGKKIRKRAPGRTRKFLEKHLGDVRINNNVDFH